MEIGIGEIIAVIALILTNIGIIITQWIRVRVRLAEVDTKLRGLEIRMDKEQKKYEIDSARAEKKTDKIFNYLDDIRETTTEIRLNCAAHFENANLTADKPTAGG